MGAALILEQDYRTARMDLQDQSIGELLAKRDEPAFEQVFKTHFKNLHAYACTLLKDETDAEEMVQQVFFKMWDRAEHLSFSGSIAAYLYRAVHNESLNFLKHMKVRDDHRLYVVHSKKSHISDAGGKVMSSELEDKFRSALAELPEQCRTVFQLSRFEELKYREIADKLGISVKTVENHMGKALKLLRQRLVDFLTLLIVLFTL